MNVTDEAGRERELHPRPKKPPSHTKHISRQISPIGTAYNSYTLPLFCKKKRSSLRSPRVNYLVLSPSTDRHPPNGSILPIQLKMIPLIAVIHQPIPSFHSPAKSILISLSVRHSTSPIFKKSCLATNTGRLLPLVFGNFVN
jgi:hypothetical protein